MVRVKDINTLRVDTKDNIAGILTKPLDKKLFDKLVKTIGLD